MGQATGAGVTRKAVDGPPVGLSRPVISHPGRTGVEVHDHLRR
ncbi:hypothetical protein ACFU53_29010 [Streptomyces sp. NPDC057474]